MASLLIALLLANAVFNVVVWPAFFRRVAKDPRAKDAAGKRTRFFTVHAVLIGLALALAVVSAVVAVVAAIQGV
ncbi:hypothetical protein QNO21_07865 [Microbacterium sp. zg-Y818]|uniref:SCO4848 family membrane protein n=1 Tax=unclassified Microbacterium TaxID=2609290 RepID=UPI00214C69EF|nr:MULTISPECIES: hypothetical protein [unclassified Microbacterium]MCR2801218.1 hypothetical protein [Microbacterium sp. zg.Y818]WIM21050.1 hypothetical protein QNO21_07865 [Microbacterium sp. zg-Y818]